MDVTTIVTIPVHDLVVGALEGGSNYWCNSFVLTKSREYLIGRPWYSDPTLYQLGSDFRIRVNYEDGVKTLTLDDFQKGAQIFADEYPSHLADVLMENDDADTADVFLQCVVLGEVIYG